LNQAQNAGPTSRPVHAVLGGTSVSRYDPPEDDISSRLIQ